MEGQVICIQQTCSADKVLEAGDRKVSQRSPAPLGIRFYGSVLPLSPLQVKEAATATTNDKLCRLFFLSVTFD